MKLTVSVFFISILGIMGKAHGQRIHLNVSEVSLKTVLLELTRQSDFTFVYTEKDLAASKPVTLNVQNKALTEALDLLFRQQPLRYQVKDKSIVLLPKPLTEEHLPQLFTPQTTDDPPQSIRGRVVNEKGDPLAGATIYVLDGEGRRTPQQAITDYEGNFLFADIPEGIALEVTYLGYTSQRLRAKTVMETVVLLPSLSIMEEVDVVSTGYQFIPRERVTGSFDHVDNALLSRSVGDNIIDRLEGLTSGLTFNRENIQLEHSRGPDLRIRGLSTIFSDNSPLIILDNFPYEGEISRINPNDIEDITILKDASASSIWGARAGNGVIVIQTKKGNPHSGIRISHHSSLMHTPSPDLFYNPRFVASADYIEMERLFFDRGLYRENDRTVLTPVVELLFEHKKGLLTDDELENRLNEWKQYDIREQAKTYLYQNEYLQQHSLTFSGGGEKSTFYTGVGWDKKDGFRVGDEKDRFTFNGNHHYNFSDRLSVGTIVGLTFEKERTNGMSIDQITSISLYPYARLVDDDGNYQVTPRQFRQQYKDGTKELGLLDWDNRPMQELKLNDRSNAFNELRLGADISYKIWDGLSLDVRGHYIHSQSRSRYLYNRDSHFTRNLINVYTQANGISEIPYGDILESGSSATRYYAGRAQLGYLSTFYDRHTITAIAGYEISHRQSETYPGTRWYGYESETLGSNPLMDFKDYYPTLPSGRARIPAPSSHSSLLRDRMVSYYANASYDYHNRYQLSGSLRWDASNLFGVRTNQRGVPLWSVGASWNLHSEDISLPEAINLLKLRMTYGRSGNINKSVSSLPIVRYSTSGLTGLPIGILTTVGNPDLRWEQVSTFNIGLDYALVNRRMSGSLEYYTKTSTDLIGDDFLDPTTGIFEFQGRFEISNRINYASLRTKGFDIELNTINLQGKFRWSSHLLLSKADNKVINYSANEASSVNDYFNIALSAPPIEGRSMDVMYAFPWFGLNGQGMQQVAVNGELSTDYSAYITGTRSDDLKIVGSRIPTWGASFRQEFRYRNFEFSVNLTGRFGGVFRRSSIDYSTLMSGGIAHRDYYQRWKAIGDEIKTYVPAMPEGIDNNRDFIYQNSEVLVGSSDNIRLRDIKLGYTFSTANKGKLRLLHTVNLYAYARNLGTLWKATSHDIDPDYPYANFPLQPSVAFGLRIDL